MKRRELKEYTIYDNYDVCSDENMEEEKNCLLEDGFTEEEITDSMLMDRCYENDRIFFEDEFSMLKSQSEGSLIAIADLGLWNGRFSGYKEIKSLEETLYSSCDYERLYVDSNGDLRKEESHHDGSNSILYRYWKEGITDEQKEKFMDKIYNGECTQKDITRYTRKAGIEIACYYGWKVRGTVKLTTKVA